MPLPQDISPVFQDIQDTLVRSDAPWIEQTPLRRSRCCGSGARPAPGRHCTIGKRATSRRRTSTSPARMPISSRANCRCETACLNAGDYVYEPSGILHDATTALEDTTYLFICNGAVLFFDENGFTRYTNWEVMEKLRGQSKRRPRPRRRNRRDAGSRLRGVWRARGAGVARCAGSAAARTWRDPGAHRSARRPIRRRADARRQIPVPARSRRSFPAARRRAKSSPSAPTSPVSSPATG